MQKFRGLSKGQQTKIVLGGFKPLRTSEEQTFNGRLNYSIRLNGK